MKLYSAALLLAAAIALLAGTAPHAHHSQAEFDRTRVLTIEGTVRRFAWANPHVYIFLEQTTPELEKIEWTVEGVGPGPLRRLGWAQDTLVAGDTITVTGNPSRARNSMALNLLSLRKGDRALFDTQGLMSVLGTANDSPGAAAASFDGVWATLLAMDVVGRLAVAPKGAVALTAAGTAALESYDEATMSPALACIPQPAPFLMFVPSLNRITTRAGLITIAGEYDATERTIHLDVADHAGAQPTLHGHSIGRWDGDTLVVDTAAFAAHRTGNAAGVPSGTRKHLVERLTRDADGTSLSYEFELTDPEFLAAAVTGKVKWAYRPSAHFELQPCDPESARRFTVDR